ncbi:MAG: response regulator [Xanthomonadales bacterium]|nr:response regulator [Xanthomonadales bacterium]
MKSAHILIVEDEAKIASLLRDFLSSEGHRVSVLSEGTEVIAWIREQNPDLVLLDLMLPGRDGLSICRELRTFSTVPVIMITARVEEIDRIVGLDLGADDYICKPFSLREVVVRVRGLLRRASAGSAAETEFMLDPVRFEASFRGQRLTLTVGEFRLLYVLVEQPGRVYSRAQLLDLLYLDHRVVTDRTVDTHIKNLRRKLQEVAPEADPIQTVYGAGYKYAIQVTGNSDRS